MNTKKRGVLIRTAGYLIPVGPLVNTAKGVWQRSSFRVNHVLTETKRKKAANRNPEILDEMLQSREAMLSRWGVVDSEGEIKRVLRGLMIESGICLVVALFTVVVTITSVRSIIGIPYLMFAACWLLSAMSRAWRYDCIKNGQFVLFSNWIWR